MAVSQSALRDRTTQFIKGYRPHHMSFVLLDFMVWLQYVLLLFAIPLKLNININHLAFAK